MDRNLLLKVLTVLQIVLYTSCCTVKPVEEPVENVRVEYIKEVLKDTVLIKDSVDRFLKGDTVFVTKYKYIYKTSYLTDTLIKQDTVTRIVYMDRIVEVNNLKLYQKLLIYIGLFSIIFVIFVLYKKFRL